jgi:hypothetical protein
MHAFPLKRLPSIVVLLACLAGVASAQLEFGGSPASHTRRLTRAAPTRELARIDEESLRAEDRLREKGQPLRFGWTHEVDLSSAADGVWETLADGGRVWRLRVRSRGARSLSLLFERFQLPVGGELFVYTDDRSVVRGAYTSDNHNPDGRFAIQPIPGQALTLEYVEPAGAQARGEIRISGIVHDYLGVLDLLAKGGGSSGAAVCETDVACPEGAPWTRPIDATVQVIVGSSLCSGVLVNNGLSDGTQYVLSAEHCRSLANAIFVFNFQTPLCGSGTAPTNQTVQGGVDLVSSTTYDVRLARITVPIPAAYHAYFAGWDRSGVAPTNTIAIHHPQGGPKKISLDDDPPAIAGTQWRVLQWDLGVTEPGSSGSALFDPLGRVIGQLCCGLAACGFPFDDYYGRMDAQWALLAPWLDPLASGVPAIDGFDPNSGTPPTLGISSISPAIVDALVPGTGKTVTITGSAFTTATTVEVDGVPLASTAYAYMSNSQIQLDMPQLATLGPHTITVRAAGASAVATIDVAPPATPKFQAGTGDPGNVVGPFAGVDLILSGQPGTVHWLWYSFSSVPSTHPLLVFAMGNNFTDLYEVAFYTIPSSGWVMVNESLVGLAFVDIYGQSLDVNAGLPAQVSNLQHIYVLF